MIEALAASAEISVTKAEITMAEAEVKLDPDKYIEPHSLSDKGLSHGETTTTLDPDKYIEAHSIDKETSTEKQGGSYGELYKPGEGGKVEVHHMPADSISPLERKNGPSIKMDKEDHKLTASYGSSRDAKEYRAEQKELIDNGKFLEALQMDIDDIHSKFGDKYDDAISELKDYTDKLISEGKING